MSFWAPTEEEKTEIFFKSTLIKLKNIGWGHRYFFWLLLSKLEKERDSEISARTVDFLKKSRKSEKKEAKLSFSRPLELGIKFE